MPKRARRSSSGVELPNMVPVERIELPTFGLQNRCSTAELNRPLEGDLQAAESGWRAADLSAGRISDLAAKGQQANVASRGQMQA
jgi:hypothetical protein